MRIRAPGKLEVLSRQPLGPLGLRVQCSEFVLGGPFAGRNKGLGFLVPLKATLKEPRKEPLLMTVNAATVSACEQYGSFLGRHSSLSP